MKSIKKINMLQKIIFINLYFLFKYMTAIRNKASIPPLENDIIRAYADTATKKRDMPLLILAFTFTSFNKNKANDSATKESTAIALGSVSPPEMRTKSLEYSF